MVDTVSSIWCTVLYSSLLILQLHDVRGLQLTELAVPTHANLKQSVTLNCRFNLDSAKLYSVKWYKDEFEFFRYMPENKPQMQVFPVSGIVLDESNSDMNKVSLINVDFTSSGVYRCEVSTEAPYFDTVFSNSNMTILAYPEHDPAISGVQSHYAPGDYITANCTAAQSNPAPEVDWYINGARADSWLVDKAPPVETSRREPLYTRSLTLRFLVDKRYFQRPDGTLHIRCTSRVADLPPRHTDYFPHLEKIFTNEKLAQQRLLNCSVRQWDANVLLLMSLAVFSLHFTS